MKLNKILIPALLLVSGSAMASSIVGSHHDLSSTGQGALYGSTTTQVCIFCHAPHNADLAAAPLWNREDSAESFTMYNVANTLSTTLDMNVAAAPDPFSAACLSCHDGVTAIDALINLPYNYVTNGNTIGWGAVDADLTNDHPISIAYSVGTGTNQDPEFNPVATAEAAGIDLYPGTVGTDQVECASCHDVHDESTYGSFLKMSNDASALCLACHIK